MQQKSSWLWPRGVDRVLLELLLDDAGCAEGAEDELDDSKGEDGDDEADDGVEDGVFGVGNFGFVAARYDVAEAAIDEHDNTDDSDSIEDLVGNVSEGAGRADEVGRDAVWSGGFGASLSWIAAVTDGEGHSLGGPDSGDCAYGGEELN